MCSSVLVLTFCNTSIVCSGNSHTSQFIRRLQFTFISLAILLNNNIFLYYIFNQLHNYIMFAWGPIHISIDSGALSSILIISCTLDKVYQVSPCFSIRCSNRGLLSIICLILNLSLKGIITEPDKLIKLPFNVTVIFC